MNLIIAFSGEFSCISGGNIVEKLPLYVTLLFKDWLLNFFFIVSVGVSELSLELTIGFISSYASDLRSSVTKRFSAFNSFFTGLFLSSNYYACLWTIFEYNLSDVLFKLTVFRRNPNWVSDSTLLCRFVSIAKFKCVVSTVVELFIDDPANDYLTLSCIWWTSYVLIINNYCWLSLDIDSTERTSTSSSLHNIAFASANNLLTGLSPYSCLSSSYSFSFSTLSVFGLVNVLFYVFFFW